MLQEVFDKLELRSRGNRPSPPTSPQGKEKNLRRSIQANALLTARDLDAFEALDPKNNRNASGASTARGNESLELSESDFGSLSADEAEKGEDGIIRTGRKKLANARFAYREDPEYWTGRRGSNILKRGRRRSSMMYPQVKETAETAALACSLMI